MPRVKKNNIDKEPVVKKRTAKSMAAKAVPKQRIYVTAQGLSEVKEELALLTTDKRKEVADRIQRAREEGDLAENSE